MVEEGEGRAFVGQFLCTPKLVDLKDNNNIKNANVWNRNASDIPEVLILIAKHTVA